MLKVGFIHSALLIALGFAMYAIAPEDSKSVTALIPSFCGFGMFALTLAAMAPKTRMHVMHFLMLLALLFALAGLGMGAMQFGKDPINWRKVISMLGMGLISSSMIFFGVRSFIAARKARKTAAAAAPA